MLIKRKLVSGGISYQPNATDSIYEDDVYDDDDDDDDESEYLIKMILSKPG